jgi:alpha-glucosidase
VTPPDWSRPTEWWQRGVVYQIYPRSFADSDGNGVGDLPGIIEHLDHLEALGVDAIWLSPIYPSPGLDLGYDVADHSAVDPLFGSMADLDLLLADAHRRDIAVILDLVLNHTSDRHAWFIDARLSREAAHADWYLWRDPSGWRGEQPLPPNNWLSFFGGSAWAWEPARRQFYLHTFLAEQPDLNWRHPAVREAQLDVVRGWLARGIDGFRLDVFNTFFKDADLRSNPSSDTGAGTPPWATQVHLHDRDQPELAVFIDEFRAIVDAEPGRMSVGELFDDPIDVAAAYSAPRHLIFDWELVETKWQAAELARAIERREQAFGSDRWPTVVLSNHDQPRHASRFARDAARSGGAADRDAIAKAAAVLSLTLRGTPFLYYGEELGLGDVDIPNADAMDPPARTMPPGQWWNRDQCRSPMPWDGRPNGGFTTGIPWLPMAPDVATRNVARETADPSSVLATYRALLALRRETPALQIGALGDVTARGTVLSYSRGPEPDSSDDLIRVAINTGSEHSNMTVEPPEANGSGLGDGTIGAGWTLLFSSERPAESPRHLGAQADRPLELRLAPYEAVILGLVRTPG